MGTGVDDFISSETAVEAAVEDVFELVGRCLFDHGIAGLDRDGHESAFLSGVGGKLDVAWAAIEVFEKGLHPIDARLGTGLALCSALVIMLLKMAHGHLLGGICPRAGGEDFEDAFGPVGGRGRERAASPVGKVG